MDITIHNIELDEQYEDLKDIVPFHSTPVRSKDNKYRIHLLPYEAHPFWAWVTYKEVESFKISPHGESYSSIIDITLHDVERFTLDYDEMSVTFADDTAISFELPVERYSNMEIDGTY